MCRENSRGRDFPVGASDICMRKRDKSGNSAEICSSCVRIAYEGRSRRDLLVDGGKDGCDLAGADIARPARGMERVSAKKKAEH
ncbi:hypothetical protein AT574_15165 [Phaeobacter inhibens]|nr:hypothetical protein AT574_15165 [Phaeobacter inhibens]